MTVVLDTQYKQKVNARVAVWCSHVTDTKTVLYIFYDYHQASILDSKTIHAALTSQSGLVNYQLSTHR